MVIFCLVICHFVAVWAVIEHTSCLMSRHPQVPGVKNAPLVIMETHTRWAENAGPVSATTTSTWWTRSPVTPERALVSNACTTARARAATAASSVITAMHWPRAVEVSSWRYVSLFQYCVCKNMIQNVLLYIFGSYNCSTKNNTSQKCLNSEIYNVFKEFFSPSLHLFDPKYSKICNILKYVYYLK